jgi:hypothetical protein
MCSTPLKFDICLIYRDNPNKTHSIHMEKKIKSWAWEQYELYVVDHHQKTTGQTTWHQKVIPEDIENFLHEPLLFSKNPTSSG